MKWQQNRSNHKIVSTERDTFIDNGEVVPTEQDTAHVLNTFFSNIVTNLKIPEYTDYDPLANSRSVSIFKLIVRQKSLCILTMQQVTEILLFIFGFRKGYGKEKEKCSKK